jgi:hypothetical protein
MPHTAAHGNAAPKKQMLHSKDGEKFSDSCGYFLQTREMMQVHFQRIKAFFSWVYHRFNLGVPEARSHPERSTGSADSRIPEGGKVMRQRGKLGTDYLFRTYEYEDIRTMR